MEDESPLSFNFWPSFADLMLSLVLILVLVLFLVAMVITMGTVNLEVVKRNQQSMIDDMAASYNTRAVELKPDVYGISTTGSKDHDIEIKNEPTFQQITFSDKILFRPDDYFLNENGKAVLKNVGTAIKNRLDIIERIQIEGHADTAPTSLPSNVHLAAFRAIEVFRFLQDPKGLNIDPAEHLMSATSFGEFNPVQRVQKLDTISYNQNQLFLDNRTPELKSRNRRIELLLFYRR